MTSLLTFIWYLEKERNEDDAATLQLKTEHNNSKAIFWFAASAIFGLFF